MSESIFYPLAIAAGVLVATSALAAAEPCMSDKSETETSAGRLSIGKAQDAGGRPERPYILTLKTPVCLKADDPEDSVDSSRTIHIFSTQNTVARQIARFVGKQISVRGRPFAAHTSHHHAPIVMDITGIEPR